MPLRDAIQDSKAFQSTYKPRGRDDMELGRRDGSDTRNVGLIVQSSPGPEKLGYQSELGFIGAIVTAYNNHLNLILRPDDVWNTILAQFAAYINGGTRAERLRNRIVNFEGKQTLTVRSVGTLFTVDFGCMTEKMADEIAMNIRDASLREWFLPGFSTSTTTDRIVASVACMCSLQNYFEYRFELRCGIPEVEMQGTVEDWTLLRSKIERLAEFDLEDKLMSQWLELLRPVCDNFVLSIQGKPKLVFWDQICCHLGGGSGPSYLSGWITVFSSFTIKGEWQGQAMTHSPDRDSLFGSGLPAWPKIDTFDLNHNHMSVPVTIDDNGIEYASMMFAGQFIFECVGEEEHIVKPRNDWCICISAHDAPKSIA